MAAAARWMTDVSGVIPALGPVPDGIEVNRRTGERGTVFILINFARTEQSTLLPSEMIDVLDGGPKQIIVLPPFGVAVLHSPRR
jgi:beta-galactosidase